MVAVAAILAPLALFAPSTPAGADDTPTTVVRVATYNVQVRRSVEEFKAGVLPLMARSDIVGLQEMDTTAKEAVLASMAESGWSYYRPTLAYQMPVMWRHDRFTLASARRARISPETYIGDENPKLAPMQHARYVTIVRLVDKVTGRHISVINAHLIHGAVKGGVPYPGRPRVFDLFKTQLTNLALLSDSEKRWGGLFVTGDYNSGWVADHNHMRRRLPIRTFARRSMWSMWGFWRPTNGLGTRGTALIDQVFSNLRPISARVQFDLAGYSDHRPAIASYRL
jgi:endonuclease/exonuclease/phosphatase (EEP) superfamily protein YafD